MSNLAQTILNVVDATIDDKYARSAIGAYRQRFTIRKSEMQESYKEAYIYIYNQDQEEDESKANRWPHPDQMEEGFKQAGEAGFRWLSETVAKGGYATNLISSTPSKLDFTQERDIRQLFGTSKTKGLRVLSAYLKKKEARSLTFYSDLKNAEVEGATSKAEDTMFRRLLHREHQGSTTTGNATLAGRIQALETIVPGFREIFEGYSDKKLSTLYKKVKSAYEIEPVDGITQIRPTGKILEKGIKQRFGSFKWNLMDRKSRQQDLIINKEIFSKWALDAINEALDRGSRKDLEAIANADGIAAAVGKELAHKIAANIGKVESTVVKKALKGTATGRRDIEGSKDNSNFVSKSGIVTQAGHRKVKDNQLTRAMRLKSLLTKQISSKVAENMEEPALVWRTGRFSENVVIRDVKINIRPAGVPSVQYSYMESPYRTFEPGGAQGSVFRNPRALIERSIRDILADEAKLMFRRGPKVAHIPRGSGKQNW